MKKENIFYLMFVLTILAMRLGVFFFPQNKLIANGMIIHHFWIGVVILLFVLLLSKRYVGLRIILFSVGLGLVADELLYIILGGGTVSNYWSVYSVSGAIIVAAMIFILKDKLIKKII